MRCFVTGLLSSESILKGDNSSIHEIFHFLSGNISPMYFPQSLAKVQSPSLSFSCPSSVVFFLPKASSSC